MTDLEQFFSLDKPRKQMKMGYANYKHYQKYISRIFYPPPPQLRLCFPESVTSSERVPKPVSESLSILSPVLLHTRGSLSLWVESTWNTPQK